MSKYLKPTACLRRRRFPKQSEIGSKDQLSAGPMTPLEARLAAEGVCRPQAEGQASPKRLRVAPLVRAVSAVFLYDDTRVHTDLSCYWCIRRSHLQVPTMI